MAARVTDWQGEGNDVGARQGGEQRREKGGESFEAGTQVGETFRGDRAAQAGESADQGRGHDVGGPRLQDGGDARGGEGEPRDGGLELHVVGCDARAGGRSPRPRSSFRGRPGRPPRRCPPGGADWFHRATGAAPRRRAAPAPPGVWRRGRRAGSRWDSTRSGCRSRVCARATRPWPRDAWWWFRTGAAAWPVRSGSAGGCRTTGRWRCAPRPGVIAPPPPAEPSCPRGQCSKRCS
jgi:hypothetical protein